MTIMIRVLSVALLGLLSGSEAFRSLSQPTRATRFLSSTAVPETAPLPLHTFAGQVEQALTQRFENIDRVLESWRLLDRDYEHREYFGSAENPEDSRCHQQCHSFVPGLSVRPFWENMEWTKQLEQAYPQIQKELKNVLNNPDLLAQGNNVWAGALTEDASSYGVGWKTLVLKDRGYWDPVNAQLFSQTAKAVKNLPAVEIFFASMAPKSDIAWHSDNTNFCLTSHLAVDIPGHNECTLTIGDETRAWVNGEVMVFDTSLMHAATNPTDKTRYILMLRVWHPELTEQEKGALQFIYDCLTFPDLVSDNVNLRQRAELEVAAAKTFPEPPKGVGKKMGFGGGSSKPTKRRKK